MYINGLLIVVLYYLGVKGHYIMAIGPLCDVRITTKYCSTVYKLYLYSMQVGYTIWYVSLALFFSTMLVKNWRLYRIFHNSRNKNRVRIELMKLLIVIICKLM